MRYDSINWMGWLVIVTLSLALLFMYLMFFGNYGVLVFMGVFIVGTIIGLNREEKEPRIDSDEYFTDEDFIHCKVGEWVSRK